MPESLTHEADMVRLHPEQLGPVYEVVFGEQRRTGPVIAQNIGTIKVTLWSWLTRRGMPLAFAEKLERELATMANQLSDARRHLRTQIQEAKREERARRALAR